MMGVKQVYPGRYDPERLLHLNEREGVTFSHCVPTILHMLLSHPVADTVLLVDSIEKTSVGKIDKKLLRRKYGSL